MATQDVDFPTQIGRWYPALKGATDRTLSQATGRTEKQIGRWRASKKWPPDRNILRIRAHIDEWLGDFGEKDRAKVQGKMAQSDTELARRVVPIDRLRDTSLPDTSATETPRVPGTYEEAKAMGGEDRGIIWAMLGKIRDDDADAWDAIREAVKAHWPERKAGRGLHPRSRTARGPTRRR